MTFPGIPFAKLGGRKFVMAFWGMNVCFAAEMTGHLTENLVKVVVVCVGAFAAGDTFITRKALDEGVAKGYGKVEPNG